MKPFTRILRLWTINRVFIRHGLDELVFNIPFMRPLAFVYHISPWNWGKQETRPRGERIRRALEDLGPIFIKFGQMLSTRSDLLPDDIAAELTRLQDRVPPFSSLEARKIIEKAYGKSVTEVFQRFETDPLASASIAQVHAAQLWDGKEVVVKVLRPGIDKTIRQDVDLMYLMAGLLQRYWKEARRLRPLDVVAEYEKTIFDELDMMREAANASQIRRNFEANPALYVPEIYWDYTYPNVIVMERIYGVPVGDIPRLRELGVNFKRLGELGVEIFFTQVFRHNFFHADMHPGNIFIDPSKPNDPQYIAVDFGIVGTLSPADKRYLAENFYAFFQRDYKRVAELHVESGWVPPSTRVDEFESAIRSVCEPIFNLPIKDISFGQFLLRLFQTARRFNMEVQPQLVLLQKTLLNIEGLGRELYPDLDLWLTAKPFIERWMDEQVGVRALFNGAKVNLPKFLENLPYMPNMLHDIMQQTTQHKLKIQWESQQLEAMRQEMRQAQRSNRLAVVGGALLVSGVVAFGLLPAMSLLAVSMMGTGVVLLIYTSLK